jgi:O-antigen/teichoic acid export membrane protein
MRSEDLSTKLVRGGFSSIAVRILSLLASFISSAVIVRLLGPVEFGRYAFVLTVITVLAIPSMLGLPTLLLREIAGGVTQEDWPRVQGIRRWSNKMVINSSLLICALAALLLLTGVIPMEHGLRSPMLLGLLLVPLLAYAAMIEAMLRALYRVFWGHFPNGVMRPILVMTMVVGVYWATGTRLSSFITILLLLATLLIVVGLGLILIRRYWPAEARTVAPNIASQEWLRALLPLSLISGLQIIHNNADLLLIGIMIDTTSVGTYRIALSIANVGIFGLTAMRLVTGPFYADAFRRHDFELIKKISRLAGFVSFVCTGGFLVVLFAFGEQLLSAIYGFEHVNSYYPAVILCFGMAVFSIWGPLGMLYMMAGKERLLLRVQAVLVIINVIGNIALIPVYGVQGAAFATAGTYCANGVILACMKPVLKKIEI